MVLRKSQVRQKNSLFSDISMVSLYLQSQQGEK